jgi:hypothetical protein
VPVNSGESPNNVHNGMVSLVEMGMVEKLTTDTGTDLSFDDTIEDVLMHRQVVKAVVKR